jgi:hypothetical protein
VDLYDESDVSVQATYFRRGERHMYVLLQLEDGLTLFATPLTEDAGFALVEDWATAMPLAPGKGDQLFFVGQEDQRDDMGLYVSDVGAEKDPDLLDDDDMEIILNAVLTPNGTELLYSAAVQGDRAEVRKVKTDGSERYEVILEDYVLADVGWEQMRTYLFGFGPIGNLGGPVQGVVSWSSTQTGRTFCPGADTLAVGQELSGQLREGVRSCYRVDLEADQAYSMFATSSTDTRLSLHDRLGNQIVGDDDSGDNNNPLIRTTMSEAGRYYLVVEGYNTSTGRFTIGLEEGARNPTFDRAAPIRPGQTIRGTITSSDRIVSQAPDFSTYGQLYYFEGSSGDQVTIDVYANSRGSEIDSFVELYGPGLVRLTSDDDGGDAGFDSRIRTTLGSSGRYHPVRILAATRIVQQLLELVLTVR